MSPSDVTDNKACTLKLLDSSIFPHGLSALSRQKFQKIFPQRGILVPATPFRKKLSGGHMHSLWTNNESLRGRSESWWCGRTAITYDTILDPPPA